MWTTRVKAITAGLAAVSAAAGATVGYFVAAKKAAQAFEAELTKQLEAAEKVFMMKHKVGMYGNPIEMLERTVPAGNVTKEQVDAAHVAYGQVSELDDDGLKRIIEGLRRDDVPDPVHPISGAPAKTTILGLQEDPEPVQIVDRNLFVTDEPEQPVYDHWLEAHPRGPEAPYIITNAEFHHPEVGYETATLTFFDGGDEDFAVLLDEQEQFIEDIDMVVGEQNMNRFGMWSGQHNIVYICNEKMEMYFEVILTRGSYGEWAGMKLPKAKNGRDRKSADE
jgi:hypothetical protein